MQLALIYTEERRPRDDDRHGPFLPSDRDSEQLVRESMNRLDSLYRPPDRGRSKVQKNTG